ncbi:MAG: M24 family metallopeptidase [Armatimonadetes bacterium]|nr:M24 family metallopeptidase [Armatimonadota bacterium]
MRRSARLCDAAMTGVIKKVRPGVSELEILFEVDYQLIRAGAEATSFPSALYIHNQRQDDRAKGKKDASTHPIEAGTAIPFEFGAVYDGYASDFGRTVWIGEPPAEYRKTFDLVMASQAAGIAAMKSGKITAAQLDAVARKVIDGGGYGAHFRHRLGHGIGMDVHEVPFLNTGDDTVLENGMAFTIEPSIILDGRWMVRVEDVVVVRDDGGESLSNYSRELRVSG